MKCHKLYTVSVSFNLYSYAYGIMARIVNTDGSAMDPRLVCISNIDLV